MEIAATGIVGLQLTCAGDVELGLGRRRKIGRAADQPGHLGGKRIEHLARGVTRRHAFRVGGKARQVGVPSVGELALENEVDVARNIRLALLPQPWLSGRRLDAGRETIFRVARRAAVDLAKRFDVVEGYRRPVVFARGAYAGKMQQSIEQYRRVAGRKHETVAVGPPAGRRDREQEALCITLTLLPY
jgi:hypothetical protein